MNDPVGAANDVSAGAALIVVTMVTLSLALVPAELHTERGNVSVGLAGLDGVNMSACSFVVMLAAAGFESLRPVPESTPPDDLVKVSTCEPGSPSTMLTPENGVVDLETTPFLADVSAMVGLTGLRLSGSGVE